VAERKLLQEYIDEAIADFCRDNGFGFPNCFVYAVSRIDENGDQILTVGDAEGQQVWQSLGLVAFMQKWFGADADYMARSAWVVNVDDEDDE